MARKVKRTKTANPPFYDRHSRRHNEHQVASMRRRIHNLDIQMNVTLASELDVSAAVPTPVPTPDRNCSWDCPFHAVCPMFDDGSRVVDALDELYVVADPNDRYSAGSKQGE